MNISKLNVLLVGDVQGFTAAMKAGGHDVTEFQSTVKEADAGIGASGGGLSSFAGGAAAAGLALAAMATAAAVGVGAVVARSLEAIDVVAKLSDSLGIATESLTRLEYAASYAGAGNEELAVGITKMLKNLSEAQAGTGAAADAFRALGLDAGELIKDSPEVAIGKIADGLNRLDSSARRVAAAQDIFGKGAVALLPLLKGGSEGLAAMNAESDKLGITLSRVDAAKVEAANDAITKIQNVIAGVGNQLAIQLSPFIQAAADKLSGFGTQGQGAAKLVVAGFEGVVKAVAATADYLELLNVGWQGLRGVASGVLYVIVKGVSELAEALDWVFKKLGTGDTEWSKMSRNIGRLAEGIGKEGDAAFEKMGNSWDRFEKSAASSSAAKLFDDIRKSADDAAKAVAGTGDATDLLARQTEKAIEGYKKVQATISELKKQVDQFGMSKVDKAVDDVRRNQGTAHEAGQAAGYQEQLDQLEAVKKRQEEIGKEAAKAWEDSRTPLEKYNAEIAKLRALYDFAAIDAETFDRASAKAKEDRDKAEKTTDKIEPARLLAAGSADAASFVAKYEATQRGADGTSRLAKGQDKTNTLLAQIRDKTAGGLFTGAVDF